MFSRWAARGRRSPVMSKKRVPVRAKQARRLIADLHSQPAAPADNHLSDEDFVGYATETLAPEQIERLDSHLAACPECTTKVERLTESSKVWRGEPGQRRLAALRARESPTSPSLLDQLGAFLDSFWYQPALSGPATAIAQTAHSDTLELETPDGQLSLFIRETENGDLIMRLDSRALELEGVEIALSAGNWQRVIRLSQVTED